MVDPFRAQESNRTFWVAILVLVLLNLASFSYFYNTNSDLRQELGQKTTEIQGALLQTDEFAKQTATELSSTKEKLAQANKKIESVKGELSSQAEQLEEQLERQGIQFKASIESVKAESEQKLSSLKQDVNKSKEELEKKLQDVKVQSQDFTDMIQDLIKSVVSIQTSGSTGSGVVLDEEGYIVTNNHVVGSGITAQVIDYNGQSYTGNVIKRDPEKDLLVLKIDKLNLPKLLTGDSTLVKVGEKVLAVGNPAGLKFSVSEGIVSAINRRIDNTGVAFIQTDTPINPGSSGGPLVNKKGEVIGINAKKYSGYEGLGFVIPINLVKDFLAEAKNPTSN